MEDYNNYRPHSALNHKSPKQYADIDLLKTLETQVFNNSTSNNNYQNHLNIEKV